MTTAPVVLLGIAALVAAVIMLLVTNLRTLRRLRAVEEELWPDLTDELAPGGAERGLPRRSRARAADENLPRAPRIASPTSDRRWW